MTKTRIRRSLCTALAAAAVLAGPLGAANAAPPDQADATVVEERDVYVIVGSTLRNPTGDTSPDAPLFNVAGVSLDLTWGAWAGASAVSTARATGPRTDVRLELSGLVPGGLYSVFWGTLQPDSEHPGCPGVERTLPLDAFHADPSAPAPNAFVAGTDGTAEYRGQAGAPLFDAGQVFFTVVYHFAGLTAYPFPNLGELRSCRSSFGEDAMRQLLILQKW